MTVPIVLNQIVQTRFWTTCLDQAAVNTLNWRCSLVTGGGANNQEVANAMDTHVGAQYPGLLGTDASYNGVQVMLPLTAPLPATVFSTASAGGGVLTAPTMGRQLCGMVSLNTAFAGPRYRGRIYIPFVPALEDSAHGVPSNAYLALLIAFCGIIGSPITCVGGAGSVTLTPCLLHRSTAIVPRTTDVVGVGPRNKFATQRRRGSYGRPNVAPI
jgi:hypothetical protein